MSSDMEIEFKFRVEAESAFDRLLEVLGAAGTKPSFEHQHNHFFDTRGRRLRRHGLALRLREEADRCTLTVKGEGRARSTDGTVLERFEAELDVEPSEAHAVLEGRVSPLELLARGGGPAVSRAHELLREAVEDEALELVGGFENERATLQPVHMMIEGREERIVFELDRTTLPGGRVDREIEVEVGADSDVEGVRRALYDLLSRAGIEWRPTTSKLARFLEQIEARP